MSETRNSATLREFTYYCINHPEERFWQALRNWSNFNLILVSDTPIMAADVDVLDTFYWEGRRNEEWEKETV